MFGDNFSGTMASAAKTDGFDPTITANIITTEWTCKSLLNRQSALPLVWDGGSAPDSIVPYGSFSQGFL